MTPIETLQQKINELSSSKLRSEMNLKSRGNIGKEISKSNIWLSDNNISNHRKAIVILKENGFN